MAFMLKRKKYYKFQVEISVEELTAVPFINVVLFAKVRLLNGGSFVDTSSRKEVCDNAVKWAAKFGFVCKMTANAATGILNPCVLRVSVRKEIKGGRSFQKLGFCDLNLAEFAGSGETSRRYLLEGYGTRQRQDNSMLTVSIKMNLLSGDILFKVPSPSSNHRPISEQEDDAECGVNYSNSSAGRMVSNGNNTANNSLPKKRSTLFSSDLVNCTDDSVRISEKQEDILRNGGVCENCLSREPQNSVTFGNLNNSPNHSNADSHFQHRLHHSPKDYRHVRNSSLNTYSDGTGPINQTKTSHECKKKVDGGSQDHSASGIDTDSLIEELIRSTIHNHPIESDDNLGLQLFIAKDGTTTLGTPRTQSRLSAGGFKEVVVKSTPT